MKFLFFRYILLVIALCLHNILIVAQLNMQDGYIITNTNDTIYGKINFSSQTNNAHECVFLKHDETNEITYNPFEIKAYRFISGKYFVSHNITLGDSTINVFLEYILKGQVNLFRYYEPLTGYHYYVDKQNNEFCELKNSTAFFYKDNKTYIKDRKEYKGLLKYYFKESNELMSKTEDLTFDYKSLLNICKDYHNEVCTNEECIIYEKKKLKPKLLIGGTFIIDFYRNQYNLNSLTNSFNYLKFSNLNTISNPSLGVFFNLNFPEQNEKVHIQYDFLVSYWKYKYKSKLAEKYYQLDYLMNISFIQSIIKNELNLKYEFPQGVTRPNISIGTYYEYYYTKDFKCNLNVIDSVNSTIYIQNSYKNPFPKFQFGVCAGIGCFIKILSKNDLNFEIQYHFGLNRKRTLNSSYSNIKISYPLF